MPSSIVQPKGVGIENDGDNKRIKLAVYNIQKQFRIYHVGVFVQGKEFHYGMRIGVFKCEPMNQRRTFHVKYCRKMICWNIEFIRYVEVVKDIQLRTNLSLEKLEKVAKELGKKYTQANYNLVNNNCLDFAREFIRRIAAKQPPSGWCWPQEIRQPLVILPVRLVLRANQRKALRREKEELKRMMGERTANDGDGQKGHHAEEEEEEEGPPFILYITSINITNNNNNNTMMGMDKARVAVALT